MRAIALADRSIFVVSTLAGVGLSLMLLSMLDLPTLHGQIASGGSRPFVTGIRTVVGPNGQIGGISVDANGVVSRAKIDAPGSLKNVRFRNDDSSGIADVSATSKLRMISLRRLEQQIRAYKEKEETLPDEIEYLAGLQSLHYVFIFPEQKDIVIAGPAEAWTVGPEHAIVGKHSGNPVMHLTDLLVALRTSRQTLAQGMTCSMDATEQGLENYAKFLRLRIKDHQQRIAGAKKAIGRFEISLTGVPRDSHFAYVLVAADVMLKRLGMQLEKSPIKQLPSYLQMLQSAKKNDSGNSMPRWWLEMDYTPLLRDADGLVWKISGSVKAMTQSGYMAKDGTQKNLVEDSPIARQWTEKFTAQYDELSRRLPVFAELQNCMDLAVLGALIARYRLDEVAGFDAGLLKDDTLLQAAKFNVPRKTEPQMTYIRKKKSWIFSVSGGIAINCWAAVADPKNDDSISNVRIDAAQRRGERWWWD